MPKILKEKIIKSEALAPGIIKMTVKSSYIAEKAVPGQFINIKTGETLDPLLRRPISICNINGDELEIVFQIKGKGTKIISEIQCGRKIDIIGPLGKGFELSGTNEKIAVVGGGIGIFPLLYLLKKSQTQIKDAFLGFRTKELVVLENEFKNAATGLYICTDDGSYGSRGIIIKPLEEQLKLKKYDIIYACGPAPMLKAVSKIAESEAVPCQVSLEQRMGCGIGACLVCACKTKYGDDWKYSHVCSDGPVFWSSEVVFDE